MIGLSLSVWHVPWPTPPRPAPPSGSRSTPMWLTLKLWLRALSSCSGNPTTVLTHLQVSMCHVNIACVSRLHRQISLTASMIQTQCEVTRSTLITVCFKKSCVMSLATPTHLWLAVHLISNDCALQRHSYQKTCGNIERDAHQGPIWHAVRVPSSSTLSFRVTIFQAGVLQIYAEQIACCVVSQSTANLVCISATA